MDELEHIKELLPKISDTQFDNFIDKPEFIIEPTPMQTENKEINSKVSWEKPFHDLMLEILDFDLGFTNAKTNFTTALLNAGVHYNPQQVYQLLELLTTRLERIHIIKRLCGFLGLHNEMDKIIDCELELIYKTPRYNIPKTVDLTNTIAGENREKDG